MNFTWAFLSTHQPITHNKGAFRIIEHPHNHILLAPRIKPFPSHDYRSLRPHIDSKNTRGDERTTLAKWSMWRFGSSLSREVTKALRGPVPSITQTLLVTAHYTRYSTLRLYRDSVASWFKFVEVHEYTWFLSLPWCVIYGTFVYRFRVGHPQHHKR